MTTELEFDVIEILERYDIEWERSGGSPNLSTVCPFHNDARLGSSKMHEETGVFHCFACHAAKNIVTFVADLEGVTSKEAYKLIRNNFQATATYDLDKLQSDLERSKAKTKIRVDKYKKDAYALISKILDGLRSIQPINIDFIQKWLDMCQYLMFVPDDTTILTEKRKEILNYYSIFLKEKTILLTPLIDKEV